MKPATWDHSSDWDHSSGLAIATLFCLAVLAVAGTAVSASDKVPAARVAEGKAAPDNAGAEKATPEQKEIKNVAILVFDGVQIIDYTGPYEVFGQARFNVFTVSETGKTITTNMGMSVNPAHSFGNSPEPDILVIPGGSVVTQYDNPRVIEWVRKKSGTARNVMSVCNGAFILARTGLLDGLGATTFYGLIDKFKEFAPKVRVVTDQRYVDNGKFITTAGLSSGIDGALHVVSKLLGQGRAEAIALNMEYDWRPESGYARAALADRRAPDVDLPDGVKLETISTKGDRDRWEARYSVAGTLSTLELLDHVNTQLAKLAGWSKTGANNAKGDRLTTWRFKDDQGGAWICETYLGPPARDSDRPTFAYRVRRSASAPAGDSKGAGRASG